MSITRLITKIAVPTPKIEGFERYMFIGPHPDDIEIGAGATAAKLVAMGRKVCYLICTDGRYGDENVPRGTTQEELIEMRKRETIKAAAAIGVNDVRFLGLSDGGFYDDKELLSKMAFEIGSFKPDIIFCPDPDVKSECHTDHLRVGRTAKALAFFAPFGNIMKEYKTDAAPVKAIAFYMTASPNRYVKTTGFLKKQLDVISSEFPTQYPAGPALDSVSLYIKLRAHEFGLRRFTCTAEGFRVLGTTQMHCLPEAGK